MNAPDEVDAFYSACTPLMRELLDELARAPGEPRIFPEIEDALGWPRRRISSVLGGAGRMRLTRFRGRRPYRFTVADRWELWTDHKQADWLRDAARRSTLAP